MNQKADRLYLRIDPTLKRRVQEYCARQHTNVTDLTTRFFVRLLEEDERKRDQPPEAEQI